MVDEHFLTLLNLIVASVNITLQLLLIIGGGVVMIMTVTVPEKLPAVVRNNPIEHEDLGKFLSFSTAEQLSFMTSIMIFWVLLVWLARMHLKWVQTENIVGMKFLFGVNFMLTIPVIFIQGAHTWGPNFTWRKFTTFLISLCYYTFALWAVGSFTWILIKKKRANDRQTRHEFYL